MHIIVGLGNYGKEFSYTKHNAGFLFLDQLVKQEDFISFKEEKKFIAEITRGHIDQQECLLVKPLTYMNNSGVAVQAIMNYYKIPPSKLIVIHDELDLDFGYFKISYNKNSAGHKGVQSIIENIATKEFIRIRIGINTDSKLLIPTEKFVLSNFNNSELDILSKTIANIIEQIKKELFTL